MKKLLLIPALLTGSLAFGEPKKIEISPMIGYNFAEGNLGFKDNGYMAYGVEVQFNSKDSLWSPELSVLFSNKGSATYDGYNYGTAVTRVAFNGVKTFQATDSSIIPFAKVGFGTEMISVKEEENIDSLFIDAGAGIKYPFNHNIALKLEALYMLKYNDHRMDSNAIAMAGLTFSFGDFAQKPAPVVKKVNNDIDRDGVLNADDKCPNTPTGTDVDATGCKINTDLDNDGVLNADDKCPNTPTGTDVDATGCKINTDLDNDGVLNADDKCPNTPLNLKVDSSGCEINQDIDNDGVLNAVDQCQNTPPNSKVDSVGCAEVVTLSVQFKSNSTKLKDGSEASIEAFVAFLKIQKSYKTKLIGYSDSIGNDNYNQKLSQKRADAIKNILIAKGIASDRISSIGKGEANPVASNVTKEGRAKNRRIEAELIKN
ncbi:MAG: OmpA family protein [Campylobacterota bacterium]|nr:OmpA family protein [Campylobacterota bacterium]